MPPPRTVTMPHDLASRWAEVAEDSARALGETATAAERAEQQHADTVALLREYRAELSDSRAQLARAIVRLDGMASQPPAPPPRVPTVVEVIHSSPRLQTAILTGVLAFLAVAVAAARVAGVEPTMLLEILR